VNKQPTFLFILDGNTFLTKLEELSFQANPRLLVEEAEKLGFHVKNAGGFRPAKSID
jgi:hypothetical protein